MKPLEAAVCTKFTSWVAATVTLVDIVKRKWLKKVGQCKIPVWG